MKKTNLTLVIASLALLLAAASFLDAKWFNKNETAYVDLTYLFDNFDYTKELKEEYQAITQNRKLQLDSMEFELKVMMEKIKETKDDDLIKAFDEKRNSYTLAARSVNASNEQLTSSFDNKILTQLSDYVVEFGEEKDYTIILGQNEQGNIMYAENRTNITDEVLAYINQKYQGEL